MDKTIVTNLLLLLLVFGGCRVRGAKHRDDSDPAGGHSGMRVYTDALTGCQYLALEYVGGIVPRVDGLGRHIGCRTDTQ